jgi:hypothetical protein
MTLCPVSAAKVSGWINLPAARRHHDVHFKRLALQGAHQFRRFVAAIPPETPTVTLM